MPDGQPVPPEWKSEAIGYPSLSGLQGYDLLSLNERLAAGRMPYRSTVCDHCGRFTDQYLAQREMDSGATHIGWTCYECGSLCTLPGNRPYCGKTALREFGIEPDDLPLVPKPDKPECDKCGKSGAELHHWAPGYLFERKEDWPTGWLCVPCHTEWHDKIKNGRG